MTIRLITFHTPKNYGAVLQGYSLLSCLKNYSDDVKVIDFNTKRLRANYPLIAKPRNLRGLVKTAIKSTHLFAKRKKYKKFDNFVKNYYCLTDRYESYEALEENCPNGDIYFTGSDQVFNPNRPLDERKAFYLNFADPSKMICSYAASFGIKNVPTDKKEEIKGYLDRYTAISVRELAGIDIVESLVKKQAVQVLDPVFLNDQEFWSDLAEPYKIKFANYLFYYRLMGNPKSDALAIKIAKEKNLKLIVMTDESFRHKAYKVLRDVGVREFLHLMNGADYIVTDSFHGVAFSLIFEKQFAFSDFDIVSQERGCDLLERVGVTADFYQYITDKEIDYNQVDVKLSGLIADSKKYIEMCCKKYEQQNKKSI